jgi:hypothetical protein
MSLTQWYGFLLLMLLHLLVQGPLAFYTNGNSLPFAGFIQIIYLLTAVIISNRKENYQLASGLLICGALTFLLVTGCAALNEIFGPNKQSGHF